MIINWKKKRLKMIGDFILLPGINKVPDDVWLKLVDQKSIKRDLKNKNLIIEEVVEKEVAKDGTKKKVKKSKKIADIKVGDMKKLITDCNNIKTLKDWEDKETRESVRLEIKKRIEIIEKENKKGNKE